MKPREESYDLVVVGGGPSGIFAAYTAVQAGLRTLLLEAGEPMLASLCPRVQVDIDGRLVRASERFRMQCKRCTCLTGLGGAAFHFDTTLGYRQTLGRSKIEGDGRGKTRSYSSLERALPPFSRAQAAVDEVFAILDAHGLPAPDKESHRKPVSSQHLTEIFNGADLGQSQYITVDVALDVIESMVAYIVDRGGEVRYSTPAEHVKRTADGYTVDLGGSACGQVATSALVVAVGKLGLPWVQHVINDLDIRHAPSSKVDVGVRLEGPAKQLAPIMEACSNPKLAFLNDNGESVRTFCVCEGGRIMQYEFQEAVLLDGQHCLTRPTKRSNLGIVTSMLMEPGVDGTEYALELARIVSRTGNGKPVACRIGDLKAAITGAPTLPGPNSSAENTLDTSLIAYAQKSLVECLPDRLVRDVLDMITRLQQGFPGAIDDQMVVAAPVIERLFPSIELDSNMQSSASNVFFVGDSSAKVIGVTYGAATGVAAARQVVASMMESARA